MQACSAAICRERASSIVRPRLSQPAAISDHSSSAGKPNASSTPPITNVGASLPVHKGATCPRRAPFRRLACIRPPWAPVYHSPGERGINGAKKKGFSHAKKLSEKPSRRNRIKKEQPPCSGRPFPVTRTKRTTKGMRSDRVAGMLSHGC